MIRRILTAAMLSATLMSSGFALSTFAQDQSGQMADTMMKSGDKMMKAHKSKRKPRKHKAKKSMMKSDKMMKSEKSM